MEVKNLSAERQSEQNHTADGIYTSVAFHDPKKQIRLVVIEPGGLTDTIRCSLIVEELEGAPETLSYSALSYAWGSETSVIKISLQDLPFQVTTNLHAALRHFRRPDAQQVLWIDALSINQCDVAEKNHQVQMMGTIYQKASMVVVWLGEEAAGSDKAMAFLKDFDDRLGLDEDMTTAVKLLTGESGSTDWKYTETGQWILATLSEPQLWSPLAKLFSREYWRRSWVMQELSLASHITLVCGKTKHRFSHSSFEMTIVFLHNVQWQSAPGALGIDFPRSPYEMAKVRDFSHSGFHIPLYTLMFRSATMLARDPRDRVFSLLGLVKDEQEPQYPVDYSKSPEQVFKEVTRLMISRQDDLDIVSLMLSLPQYRQTSLDLPSWVPDFSPYLEDGYVPLLWGGETHEIFKAAGTTTPSLSIDPNSDSLNISGFCLDSIKRCSGEIDYPCTLVHGTLIPSQWFPFARRIFNSTSRTAANNLSRNEVAAALSRTLIADRYFHDLNGPIRASAQFYDELSNVVYDAPVGSEQDKFCEPYRRAVLLVTQHRQLIRTQSRFIGLGSSLAKEGDLICILLGIRIPLILRKEDTHYVIIGDCYIDGVMDGQAIPDMEAGKYKVELFNIQ